jgi:hypothetical protein
VLEPLDSAHDLEIKHICNLTGPLIEVNPVHIERFSELFSLRIALLLLDRGTVIQDVSQPLDRPIAEHLDSRDALAEDIGDLGSCPAGKLEFQHCALVVGEALDCLIQLVPLGTPEGPVVRTKSRVYGIVSRLQRLVRSVLAIGRDNDVVRDAKQPRCKAPRGSW